MKTTRRHHLAPLALLLALCPLASKVLGQSQPLAWGWNSFGQLGINSTTQQTTPTPLPNSGILQGKVVSSLSGGEYHTLALCADGSVASWGWNVFGQLGDGSSTQSLVPVWINTANLPSANSVVAVAAGQLHSLALTSGGSVFAWGHNNSGQLGTGGQSGSPIPVPVHTGGALAGKTVVAIAAGYSHNLVLCSDGSLATWGSNHSGELGDGTTTQSLVPVLVNTTGALAGRTVVAIAAGHGFNLVLCSDGALASWGVNSSGALGNNSFSDSSTPVLVQAASSSDHLFGRVVVAIAAGASHALALCADGTIAAWGKNGQGQLGENTSNPWRSTPGLVNTTTGVSALFGKTPTAIAAGADHSFALCSDGLLVAWGRNSEGQLGDLSTSQRPAPVATDNANLPPGATIAKVFSGSSAHHSLALATAAPCDPAILVRGSSVTILNGDLEPTGGDSTDFFNAPLCPPSPITHEFAIHNFGDCPLVVTNIISSNPLEFSVSSQPLPLVVPPGSFSLFSVAFLPNAAGPRSATITLHNNDPTAHPYSFAVAGHGVAPTLGVLGGNPSLVILDGDTSPSLPDHTLFPSLLINTVGSPHFFTLTNTGTATLNLLGTPPVAIGGLNPTHFTITQPSTTSLAPGASTTFAILFHPTAVGPLTATLHIDSDACDTSHSFAIAGEGLEPEPCLPTLLVRGLGLDISHGDTQPTPDDNTAFANSRVCGPEFATHEFTIHNPGDCPLVVTNISSSNSAEFFVTSSPLPLVVPGGGGTTNFWVAFLPVATGQRAATITLEHNGANPSPHSFAVAGNGVAAVLAVLGGSPPTAILNNDPSPSPSDNTLFNPLLVNTTSPTHFFTLTNSGTATLNLVGAPPVAIGGLNPTQFTVTQPSTTSLAPGASTTFGVVFHPTGSGVAAATLSIQTDICDSSHLFAIAGEGIPPLPFQLDCAPDKTIKCDQPLVFDPPTPVNPCGGGATINVVNTVATGSCPQVVTRTWLATDACGNTATCSQSVSIIDTQPPVLVCPPSITRYTCEPSERVHYAATAIDACSPTVSLTYNPPSGTPFPTGTTTQVTVTATDACGNISTCSFTVKVVSQTIGQILTRGRADCHNLLIPDPAPTRSACLNAAYSSALWKSFDVTTINRRLGVSWQVLPSGITAAQVSTRMKPRKTLFNLPQNDTISFGLASCAPASWLWSRQIGSHLGQFWSTQAGCGVPILFNLASLPPIGGLTSLLPHLNAPTHRLDMLVENDTTVDFAALRLRRCFNIIIHNHATMLNGALVVATPLGPVLATDPDSPASVDGTATIDLGGASQARLELDLAHLALNAGGRFATAFSLTDADDAVHLHGFRLQSSPGAAGPGVTWQPFAPMGAQNPRLRFLLEGREILVLPGLEPFRVAGPTPRVEIIGIPSVLTNTVRFPGPVPVQSAAGGPAILVDTIEFHPGHGDAFQPVGASIVLTVANKAEIGILGLDAGPESLVGAPRGEVLARVSDGTLALSPLDGDSDEPIGLDLAIAPTREFRAFLGESFGLFEPTSPQARLSLTTRARLDGVEQDLPSLRFSHTDGGWRLSTSHKGEALPLPRIQIWDNGMLLHDIIHPTNNVWSSPPTLCWPTLTADSTVVYRFPFDSTVEFIVDGAPLVGSEIRIIPSAALPPLEALTGLRVEAVRAELLSMPPLEAGPVEHHLAMPEWIDGEVVIRWTGPGGILESAQTIDGAWTPVPGAVGGEFTTPAETTRTQYFRVRAL